MHLNDFFTFLFMLLLPSVRSLLDDYSISSLETINTAEQTVKFTRTYGPLVTSTKTFLRDAGCQTDVTRGLFLNNEPFDNQEVLSTVSVDVNEIYSARLDNIFFNNDDNLFEADDDMSHGKIKFCLKSTSITDLNGTNVAITSYNGVYAISYNIHNTCEVNTDTCQSEPKILLTSLQVLPKVNRSLQVN